ncbi:katanin p80 WD40 repeat-containing subunit B1 isoform X1 [Corythoichthys intestinalis]|uniref:katanin p80 WD40 repeat-containing subunit B1 isoform X1 n=1 Tax=Corythoichthys intestinalis TaxID=161448 RepID=UPI0025A4F0BA|nr:katanin p80 WD40 repeat-containing subunit B1 isoform X1 [Corythoichthys intestinalis]
MATAGGATKISWRLQDFEAHAGRVCCAALAKNTGRLLASGGEDCRVNIWSVSKANCIMSLCGHRKAVECVCFNASEEQLATGSQSGSIRVWDLEAAKILRTLTGHKSNISAFAFHPFGDFLVSGSTDANIKMWDGRRKGPITRFKGHAGTIRSLAFSPDGKWLASASDDCTVKVIPYSRAERLFCLFCGLSQLWDLKQAKTITEFTAHTGAVAAIQFHPNEYLLASGGADRWLRLWDLEKFCQVGALQDASAVRCVMFSPDGGCLFSGHADVLRVCAWEPERWLDSVTAGWGRVVDLSICNRQLLGVSHQLSGLSTYVVDLKRVRVGGAAPSPTADGKARRSYEGQAAACPPPTSSSPPGRPRAERRSPEGERRSPSEDEADDKVSSAEIHDALDYREIFQPRDAISRTPPRMPEPFPAPPEDERATEDAAPVPQRRRPSPDPKTDGSESAPLRQGSPSPSSAPVQRVEPTVVASARPPAIFPVGRSEPTGLDVADFLSGRHSEMLSEDEVLNHIHNGHATMCVMLSNRRKNLQSVRDVWARVGIKNALDAAVSMNDLSIVVDVLNIINTQPSLWKLDLCASSLPQIEKLLQSKYESYTQCGCSSLKLIMKYFWPLIRETLNATPSVGVDVTREERQRKCRLCRQRLRGLRDVVESKAALAGRHGSAFGELRVLMAPLDRDPAN